jgi:uncharacterized membrane protein
MAMTSRAKMLGHPIHPMLIPFPIGLLTTGVVFDIIYLINDRPGFNLAAAYALAAGVIGGIIAAPFGLIDWFVIPAGTRAKQVGVWHLCGNVVALICSFVGVVIAAASGWLGGELVDRLAIGIDEGANPDAPSSLSHKQVAA